LFYTADFAFTRSRRSELHTLREVNLCETRGAIRENIAKLRQAGYVTAFLEQATETEAPLPEVFEIVRDFLKWLCANEPKAQSILALELKLLCELGLMPDLEEARLTAGAKKIARVLLEADWTDLARLKPSPSQTHELQQWLHGFLIFHLGRLPRGRAAALGEEC
jgi:DNA repair protein RecO (recombination protein O)